MLDNIKFERNFSIEIESTLGGIVTIGNPFTIEFNVVRNVQASANTATIKILNLSERVRNIIYKDRYATVENRLVTLKAGYKDDVSIIFKGELRSAESYREGTEFITEIDALDGGLDIYKSVSSNTVAKGTPKIDALKGQIDNFTNVKELTIGEFSGTYKRGRVFFGNTWDLMKIETNNNAFIDNQSVNVLNDNEVKQGGIQVINSDTGLLNSPRRSNTLIVFKILFEPRLIVGQELELVSSTNSIFNGVYKVGGINHTGTISGAVSGKCETEVSMFIGSQALTVVTND
ncbi:hypothetical protein KAR91_59445 [Candidatus Pacearchaeota archaeon]|nr:hypothetical protein [Candidatus Pacearchaeota archaeon]